LQRNKLLREKAEYESNVKQLSDSEKLEELEEIKKYK